MEISITKLRKHAKLNKGFSIIEILIAVFIFSVIVMSVGAIFTRVLALQRRGTGAQKVQENVLFALELMAREIRVSSFDNQDTDCGQAPLSITHPVNGQITYSLSGGSIVRLTSGGGGAGGLPSTITSKEVEVTRLNFCVDGTEVVGGVGDQEQSRVTIIIQVRNRTNRPQDVITFDLQTTVVSRDNEVEFVN